MNQLEKDQIGVATASADAKNDSQENRPSPPYLKLIADCWEDIFDYLSFNDILLMGQTCKRMNQMAGYYVREYYPELKFQIDQGDIRYKHFSCLCITTDFYRFISVLNIAHISDFGFFLGVNRFDTLKTLIFSTGTYDVIRKLGFWYMRTVLKNVENIKLNFCKIDDNIFEQIAIHCPKLKRLEITRCVVENCDEALFSQRYPALEQLKYQRNLEHLDRPIHKLKMFLENHLNLKQFQVDFGILWTNRDMLQQTHVQLDLLNICFGTSGVDIPFDQFVDFLKTLHDRTFYKTLQFAMVWDINVNIEHFNDTISELPALEKIYTLDDSHIDLTRLPNLKSLQILSFTSVARAEIVAKSLLKLELLATDDTDAILRFIRYSKRLKSIKMVYLRNDNVLDLLAWNAERKQLENACQVTLWVPEKIYLAEKWKSQNLKLDLVKVERLDSYDLT